VSCKNNSVFDYKLTAECATASEGIFKISRHLIKL